MALNPHSPFEIETKMFGGGSHFLSLPDRRRMKTTSWKLGRCDDTENFRVGCFMITVTVLRWPNGGAQLKVYAFIDVLRPSVSEG